MRLQKLALLWMLEERKWKKVNRAPLKTTKNTKTKTKIKKGKMEMEMKCPSR